MNNQLKFLYKQIKEGKISQDDAIKKIKEFKTRYNQGLKPPPSSGIEQELLREKATNYFKKLLSSVIKLPAQRIEADAPMEKYGIDSIMVMRMTNQLEKVFGSLSKTLFYEYQNIRELTGYFLESYRDQLIELLGVEEKAGASTGISNSRASAIVTGPVKSAFSSRKRPRFAAGGIETRQEKITGALDIAIIGLSGRYPRARNIREFWENLRAGKDCITEIPKDRWDQSLYFDEEKNKLGKTYSKWGGFLEGVDQFDPLFFNISPREAVIMDPQERLFLECVFETLEDAGYTRETPGLHQDPGLAGNVGVYVGVMYEEYPLFGAQEAIRGRPIALSGNPSSIANRVSYFCNFHGPSMAVDTMCSSSLTAIHLACQSLQRGECQSAIAGGVNVSIHPNKYLMLGQGNFLSSKGRCESFGQGGDGYVPGEGVGAVLLKPLSKAIAHRDHIYGIIKASAINHGGKTNGYSVPNPNAQASVMGRAFKEARINPRTISYIEAHGTGTSLGDPIEIAGLTKTFREYTKDRQFCAIGSAKSNIGHCESAAGIAGVTKVLLQLQHHQLVPSLHSRPLNPNIDFSTTPFVVQQDLAEWKPPRVEINGETREYPRIAGISSFGAGGANAHVVIEEYRPKDPGQPAIITTRQHPAIIVLSAKNEERLRQQVQRLLAAIRQQQLTDTSLADIAYTLQVGREPMEERLAVTAGSIKELEEKLKGFGEGQGGTRDLYRGQVKRNEENSAVLAADEDMAKTIDAWISKKKYTKLLDLWVKGLVFDWNKLYDDSKPRKPRRISLPTYPFAGKRYWIPVSNDSPGENEKSRQLHPLLDRVDAKQSLEQGVVFLKTLQSSDLIVKDHKINGQSVFPGVGYLEMAHAAAAQINDGQHCHISRVVWQRPLFLQENEKNVQIVMEKENGQLKYKVRTGNGSEPVIHSQGEIRFSASPSEKIDQLISIEEVQSRCTRRIDRKTLYDRFHEAGLAYGPYFRGLKEIRVNENGEEALGLLSLPSQYQNQLKYFTLQPTLMDGALQTIAGLTACHHKKNGRVMVPFSTAEVELLHPLQSEGYAYVKAAGEKSYHVAILDSRGEVCVKFHHLAIRELKDPLESFFYTPRWKSSPLPTSQTGVPGVPQKEDAAKRTTLLIFSEEALEIKQALADALAGEHVIEIKLSPGPPTDLERWFEELEGIDMIYFLGGIQTGELDVEDPEALELSQQKGVLSLFRLIKTLSHYRYAQRKLQIKVITNDVHEVIPGEKIKPYGASLHGLCKSMVKEYPQWETSCIDISLAREELSKEEQDTLAAAILAEPGDKMGREVALRSGRRYIRVITPLLLPPVEEVPLRHQGVYLILGGAGGIGLELGYYLAETAAARLILVGRSELDAEQKEKISRIESRGGEVLYLQADAANLETMKTAVEKAKSRFGPIHGVFHSAIVLRDKTLPGMDEETFCAALAPKVKGSVILNKVIGNEPLDFMMFFSSAQSFYGNAGQGNYAAASTFKDAFALYLNQTKSYPVKIINWGYWGSVGIVANEEIHRRFASQGIYSIEPEEGMEAVKRALGHRVNQIIPIKARDSLLKTTGGGTDHYIEIFPEDNPSLISLIQGTVREMKPLQLDINSLSQYQRAFVQLERFGQFLLLDVFQQMGVFRRKGEHYVSKQLRERLNIVPGYFQLYEVLLDILMGAGFIEINGREIAAAPKVEEEGLQKELAGIAAKKEELLAEFPGIKAHVHFLWTCVRHYPEILRGNTPATEIIFPESSMELVESVYKNNTASDYFNHLVARGVLVYIKARLPLLRKNEKIKIVEVGAGTGGTSAVVLEAIKDYAENVYYMYTDISGAFTLYGKKNFGTRCPFVEFKTLDIEKELKGQGYAKGEFDIAIAANVLHATRRVRDTIGNVKTLLKTNGWLILYEATGVSNFTTLTFGLLDGWWLFEDEAERLKGAPLLSSGMWERLLKEEGFERVMALSQYETGKQDSPQQVLVAESNGILNVRKQVQLNKEEPVKRIPENAAAVSTTTDQEQRRGGHRPEQKAEELKRTIENQIIETVSGVLQIEKREIDPDAPYSDFGVDSILAVSIIQKLNENLTIDLQAVDLFNYSTIRMLSQHIAKEFAHTIHAAGNEDKTRIETSELFNKTGNHLFEKEESDKDDTVVETEMTQDIAIIGMAGQFSDAGNVDEFWKNLQSGKDSIRKIPVDRWNVEDFLISGFRDMNKGYFQWGGFLSEIDRFDPLFFNISPREAELMDPQQRLFLQEAWKALEDAGYSAGELNNKKCGVFVGCGPGDYGSKFNEKEMADAYAFSGIASSILAARIAYLLNLKGPSLAIDTACSSSLVAVHLACESIHRGTSKLAIAGGVTLITTPNLYVNFSKAGMLSPGGRCKTFDNGADGFVPGEGAAAVVLKPLELAVEEGDHIYGVIKGSEINQDGKTNGITAPSATSQTTLECEVYDRFKIHPETISYIEAHGTGTKLGDPIEIQALTAAFNKYTQNRHYCAVGSVKTNIGHTLHAAGIAGLIKVLLSLQHKQLPPSLNFKKANEHINFRESPFYVNTQLKEWPGEGNLPRRAAVSSFGFSGTNCHIIVEEAPVNGRKIPGNGSPYYLIPLSAKTASSLRKKMEDISQWLDKEGKKHSINDIAYTLSVGRSHFSVRSALLVKEPHDLEQKLKPILAGAAGEDCFTNKVESKSPGPAPVFKELGRRLIEELKNAGGMEAGTYKEKLYALADLYTQGYDLDWRDLYEGRDCCRISLPTYPFDLERYWISESERDGAIHGGNKKRSHSEVSLLHPLIGRNISTLQEEKFVTHFTGHEFYLSHHIINGQKILPGVAFIEMVRAAGELAGEKPVAGLRNIVWLRPIVQTKNGKEIYISLYPNPGSDKIDFEVSSSGEDNQRFVHARGQLTYENPGEPGMNHEPVDIDEIKQRCTGKMEGKTCYRLYREMGLRLGPGFQVVQELYSNETEVLSLLRLPEELNEGFNDFILHPSMMDGSLQSGIALGKTEQENSPLLIPFFIGEVDILAPLSKICYGHLKVAGKPQSAEPGSSRCDVRIMDETGKVLVKMKDCQARPLPPTIQGAAMKSKIEETARMYFHSVWEKKELAQMEGKLPGCILIFDFDRAVFDAVKRRLETEPDHGKEYNSRLFLVKPGEHYQDLGNHTYEINPGQMADYRQFFKGLELQSQEPVRIIHNWSQSYENCAANDRNEEDIKSQLDHGIYSLFHLSRVLMNQNVGNKNKFEILYIYPGHEDGPLPQYAALSGFAKTIRWENSNFIYKTVEIRNSSGSQVLDASQMAEVILKELQAGMDEGKGIEVSYRNEHRWEKVWKAFDPGREVKGLEPLKEKGVYLITGGMGGLGMIFARYLAKKVKARLVLAGRSDLGAEGKTCLQELESLGSEVVYIRTDVSKYEDVKNLIKKAKSRYQSIDGIIHSAGITRDAFLQKKTPEDMEEVLAPKIYGTRYLDGATREENLDFFVLFSSTAAVLGNVGQCDYAYANSFMDYFAERREILRQKQERSGKTFSINWPLWQEGRLKVNKPTGEFLQRTMGVKSLETGVGLKAFAEILASGERQVMILAGESQKIRQIVENSQGVNKQKPMDANLAEPGHQVNVNQDELWRKIQKDVVKMVSAISKVKENRLSDNKNLAEYGFDSITFVEFTNTINKKFNLGITPAVFFEYPSLGTFTGYLYKQYRESFARYYREHAVSSGRPIINKGHEDIPVEKKISTRFQDRALGFARKQPGRRGQEEIEPAAIAIIGMSGVMPQSENLDIFWKHLEAGEDLITKIPRERWELGDMNEVVRGGFMKEVDKFDALFFGISPREAELMDPQQRIFLETAWKTIEDAGYRVSDLSGTRTGVFVGVSTSDYGDIIRANEMKVEPHLTTGMSHCVLANRISYLFNFHGPSEPIDTACSSALIALHRAVESIRGGNCEMAIAGGVNVLLSPAVFISFSKAGMLSPDGRCKTFDKRANGYVRGEGSGAVFLKPLARAIKDGDHIYAVIKGTAVNHGGHASSLTAPNPVAQADLLIEAYEKAGIDPSTVTYIEAHGTGTSLGDPVEINGLKRAFAELYKRRGQSPRQGYCGIGSVKTNIGHLEAAAGIAGLLKVLLAMKHKKLPANVHFKELNPYIQLENSPFYILKETRPWENFPRRAGVSSFGFGGANAHLVLEEYKHPVSPQAPPTREPQIIVLSARNEERLKTYARNIVDFLEKSESSVTSSTSSISARTNRNRENLLENIQKTISDFISEIINVGEDDIDLRENIAEYGFDPVRFSDLANRMSKKYELEIKTDIFSEYSSINKLAQYVIMHKHIPGSPGSPDSAASGQSDQNDRNSPPSPLNLPDIAYTLQVGRKPMEERLAVIASGIREVRESLTHYCQEDVDGDGDIENFFHGNSGESKSISGLLLEGNEGREYQDIIFHEKKFEKLAKLWVSGVDINWELLYRGNPPNRVSLPTYPFARERYWVAMNKPMRKPGIEISPTREQHGESNEIPPPAVVENDGKSYRDILFAHKPGQRKDMLESFLSEKIARMLRLSSTQKLDPRQPLVNVGLDSLMALQLKKEIEVDLRMNVSMIKFLGGESAADMAGLLLRHLVDNDQNKETGISPTTKMKAAADLDDLQNDLIEGVL